MTLLQLEYIVVLDTYRNFSDAAKYCGVTQPTLSIQIKKIEDELGVLLFYRDKYPVTPTNIGKMIIAQAHEVLEKVRIIKNLTYKHKNSLEGTIKLGILPTICTSLLPLLMQSFSNKYPGLILDISERKTDQLLDDLHMNKIDMAIMVYPKKHIYNYVEFPLFYERFLVYLSEEHPLLSKSFIHFEDIEKANSHTWVLEDGHCFKDQCFHFLNLNNNQFFHYQVGQIDVLKKMVNSYKNTLTILPELLLESFSGTERLRIRPFSEPQPVRQVSLITQRGYSTTNFIQILQQEIQQLIPKDLIELSDRVIISL